MGKRRSGGVDCVGRHVVLRRRCLEGGDVGQGVVL